MIPIVVYHGQRRWTAPLSLSGLFRSPPALAPFLPEQRYVLLDLQAWKKEEIIGGLLLRVTLLVLQAIFRPNLPFNLTAIAALLRQLGDQVLREQELGRILTYATRAGQGLSVAEFNDVATAADPKGGGTIAMTLAEKWLAEGLHVAIEDALHDRFGDAGLALMAQIRLITSSASLRNILRAIHRSTGIDEVRQGLEGLAS
ncbi:MAG: Rpn family recombination-promoting nuclease/putative transposase [Ardenticatenia bacterium]|nr:Rpn family recombination-promoting nuclease/putative transposase [Ardenticatenia bacterium]